MMARENPYYGLHCLKCTYLNDRNSLTCIICDSNLGLLVAPTRTPSQGYSPSTHFARNLPPRWEDATIAAQLQHQEYDLQVKTNPPAGLYKKVPATIALVEQFQSVANGNTPGANTTKEVGWGKKIQELDEDEAFAAQLQNEEFGIGDDDAAFASQLQEDDQQDSEQLVREEQHALRVQRDAEEIAMMLSSSGVAWKLVEQVTRLSRSLSFAPLGIDDMVILAERFIEKQLEFEVQGKPKSVTIAYHNTKPQNLEGIQQVGLMTPGERMLHHTDDFSQQSVHHQQGHFGEGIYTANNPEAFKKYGTSGLLVAILKGQVKRIAPSGMSDMTIDSGVGNKSEGYRHPTLGPKPLYRDETVLRTASQCLPLVRYDASSLSGTFRLWECHLQLQKLMDDFFNEGVTTTSERITLAAVYDDSTAAVVPSPRYPSLRQVATQHQQQEPTPQLNRQLVVDVVVATAVVLDMTALLETLSYSAPHTLFPPYDEEAQQSSDHDYYTTLLEAEVVNFLSLEGSDEQCFICFADFNAKSAEGDETVVRLVKCQHLYHKTCLQKSLSFSTKCAVCRDNIIEPRGTCPSGTMTVSWVHQKCQGYEYDAVGTFMIEYNLPAGVQKDYHPNPGTHFQLTHRKAYVPYTSEAWALMKRLAWAWMHGLTFTVGTSMTTQQSNCIVWASIHHKTSSRTGPHGFPDPNYIANCNADLDALNVPAASTMKGLIL